MAQNKLPVCKSPTMTAAMQAIVKYMGYSNFELQWEITTKAWELRVKEIDCNPMIFVYKDNPDIINVTLLAYAGRPQFNGPTAIDVTQSGWEKLLCSVLNYNYNNAVWKYNEHEKMGFNAAMRSTGWLDKIFSKPVPPTRQSAHFIFNNDYKVKAGGRTAPAGGREKLKNFKTDEDFYDFLDGYSMMNVSAALKDIGKIDWEYENAGLIRSGITSTGLDYVAGWVCMDYGLPMLIFLYWDGKAIRAYVPIRGNFIDTINNSMINQDHNCGEYLKKNFPKFKNLDPSNPDHSDKAIEILTGIFKDPDFDACLEEFTTRVSVK